MAADAVDEYPDPIEPIRISLRTSKVNAVLGTDLDDAQVIDALAPLGIAVEGGGDEFVAGRADLPPRPRARDRPRRRGRPARRASTRIGRTVPKPARPGGRAQPQPARTPTRRRRARRRGVLRGGDAPAGRAGRPRARGRAGRPPRRGRQPAAGGGVGAAHPRSSRACCGPSPPTRPRASRRRLFEMGHVFLAPDGDGPAARTSGCTSPWRARGTAPPASARGRSAPSTRTTRRRRPASVLDALELADVALEAAVRSGFHAGPDRRGARRRRRRRRAWVRSRRGARRPRAGPRRSSRPSSTSARCSRPTGATARSSRAVAVSRRRPSTSRFVVAESVASGGVAGRSCARRPAICSKTSDCSTCSAPTRSAPGAGALRSRCDSAPPTARSPTTRSARLSDPVIAAVTRRTRGRAPGLRPARMAVRPPRAARATPRSTPRAWCSTPTGSRTSTKRAPAGSRHMGFAPAEAFFRDFDVMLVKAVLEWQGPAGFDDVVEIAVTCPRLGT